MDQHPIPQNVTKYQFRLIGDMTIKQFGVLMAGGILGVIVYKLPLLPSFFRLPLAGILIAGGAAMAFVPFEERTLDVWLFNFIKAIYNPTQYLWNKTKELPDYFKYTPKGNQTVVVPQIPQSDRSQLEAYLNSMKVQSQNPLDQYEQQSLKNISSLFQTTPHPPPPSQPNPVRTTPPPPAGQQPRMMQPLNSAVPLNSLPPSSFQPTKQQAHQPISASPPLAPLTSPLISAAPPLTPPIRVHGHEPIEETPKPKINEPGHWTESATPQTPEVPNTIVGVAVTQDARLLQGIIVEVRDHEDMPIRVAKTNATGQFYIATPLKNGHYTISPEHPQYNFDTIDLDVKGEVIPAFKLVARENYQPIA